MSTTGVVIIGRNEGRRLAGCLQSVRRGTGSSARVVIEIVYVDSNSSDDSVEIAKSQGAQVVELDPAIPFTAARARNAGAELLLKRHPELEFLQFLDGDTELHPRWLAHAADYLEHHPRVAIVCGRRRERFPERSMYNLLADMEWDTPIGPAGEFGGDAMVRTSAFLRIGGYNSAFIAGEEPDFAARLRLAAPSADKSPLIVRLNHEMTLHDLGMTRFTQWWRRSRRSGHALAQLAHTHGRAPLFFYRRQRRSTLVWGPTFPLMIVASAILLTSWLLLLLPLGYAYLSYRVFRYRVSRGDDRESASIYAFFTSLGKVPQFLGLVTFYKNLWLRRTSRLMEYKSAEPVPAQHPSTAAVGST